MSAFQVRGVRLRHTSRGAIALAVLLSLTVGSLEAPALSRESLPRSGVTASIPVPGVAGAELGARSIPDFDASDLPVIREGTRYETTWVLIADFEDTTSAGNTGWFSLDLSGTVGHENYWHIDTFNAYGDTGHSWWCGTYDSCWASPYGYGNGWTASLEHDFDFSPYNDSLELDFRQKFAMEHNYDYGYVEVRSPATGGEYVIVSTFTNPGFTGKPGTPQNWDSPTFGHWEIDLIDYLGESDVSLRFRFESDDTVSSKDCSGAVCDAVAEGAWYLDEITITADGGIVFYDDCEDGQGEWRNADLLPGGQTGVDFQRRQVFFDPQCPCYGYPWAWGYAAVDSLTGQMVDGQNTVLISPAIDISGADKIIGQWDAWIDLRGASNDRYDLWLSAGDDPDCIADLASFVDESQGSWYGTPCWGTWTDDWSAFAGNDWLRIMWKEYNTAPASPPSSHSTGVFLNSQRVGVVTGDPGIAWDYGVWNRWHDTFDLEEALSETLNTLCAGVSSPNGIESVWLMGTNDYGQVWHSFAMVQQDTSSLWCLAPPAGLIQAHKEIWYYLEATDGLGTTATLPRDAPQMIFEFSILPINATVTEPRILLVDKHGRRMPSEERDYRHYSEYYYREALDILGYEYEVYDVEVPSGSTDQSNGPDTSGMKYYDTQIWFANDFNAYTIKPFDQKNLIHWLSQAPEKERNLLLSGNDIGYDLIQCGQDSLNFYRTWLATEYIANTVADTLPMLRPPLPDWGEWDCLLAGGCP